MRIPLRQPLTRAVLYWIVMVILHAVLLHVMAARDVVSKVFAAGQHLPAGYLALIGLFFFVRLTVVLALPGLILTHLGQWAVERWWPRAGRG